MKLTDYLIENANQFRIDIDWLPEYYCKLISDFSDMEIIIDDELRDWGSGQRRPYYRLRGKRITEEQAFDIISKTDDEVLFDFRNEYNNIDKVNLLHFRNFWITRSHYPSYMGWVQPNGIVGGNGITDKYPEMQELLEDIINIKINFPYLEFMVAITFWDEIPDYEWEKDWEDRASEPNKKLDDYKDFYEAIDIVFHVYENKIEVLNEGIGAERYKEKIKEYEDGIEDDSVYASDYYEVNGINPVSEEFLQKFEKLAKGD